MSKRGVHLVPFDEGIARRMAHILGDFSAPALAIAELERRRSAGEKVELLRTESSIVVGPTWSDE